jgi:hypothetical protein
MLLQLDAVSAAKAKHDAKKKTEVALVESQEYVYET